uniref:Uncharacterized protein n=1 Tax=Arundo donax TaxID=35708 RepID=A0A0A9EEH0_ARUDO
MYSTIMEHIIPNSKINYSRETSSISQTNQQHKSNFLTM